LGTVPGIRIRKSNTAPVNSNGSYILYWMIAYRRNHWNFSLQRAVEWAKDLNKPLAILEALRCNYPWASDRLHGFLLEGMAQNAKQLRKSGVFYYPYVEETNGAGKGLLTALARKACVVVTDEFPAFFLPRMVAAASERLPVLLEVIDSNGLLPMRAADKVFTAAYAFRRFIQKNLPSYLTEPPIANPLAGVKLPKFGSLPKNILKRWPMASWGFLHEDQAALASLPIDHEVGKVTKRGGSREAHRTLKEFLENRLPLYLENRNQPEKEGSSGLSPYLHFGYISVHEVFDQLMKKEGWSLDRLSSKASGSRSGWWGVSESAEAFLDQLITWRELGFNMCWQGEDYQTYESLPDWALKTLKNHEKDPRPFTYTLHAFEKALTHDPLWNAAQIQLVREGFIHNYLRMLWGKKILEWTKTPREAMEVMIELNDKYALDGRDPNSYSGIFWVLGRYDRAWGPERPVFGKVRYMSSKNTARKVRVTSYMEDYKR
jgi:deoxyribodipyrimidine photo-lyase